MQHNKDEEQDALIRQNAENIRQNQEAIRRQTAALEKIRDHYFPKKGLWKKSCEFFLKAVGAVTVAAGLLEAADWCWNTRQAESMAAESAAVAKRLFEQENDACGAIRFLEKAVELDDGALKYRLYLASVKGFAAIGDLFDLGRPLTDAERARTDDILAEAVCLQEMAPDEPMPFVLAAQARMLRGEPEEAIASVLKAVALDPKNVQARVSSCAMHFMTRDIPAARKQLSEAERLNPNFPLVLYWKAVFAFHVDKDVKAAHVASATLVQRVPRMAMAHLFKGLVLKEMRDFAAAYASFARAIALSPKMTRAMVPMAETCEQEGDVVLARLWLDRALSVDPNCMAALLARARLGGANAVDDLTRAISLAPFRADLYRLRAAAHASAARSKQADEDIKFAEALEAAASALP